MKKLLFKCWQNFFFLVGLLKLNFTITSAPFPIIYLRDRFEIVRNSLPARYQEKCIFIGALTHKNKNNVDFVVLLQLGKKLIEECLFPKEMVEKIVIATLGNYFVFTGKSLHEIVKPGYNDNFKNFIITECRESFGSVSIYRTFSIQQKPEGDIDGIVPEITQKFESSFSDTERSSIERLKESINRFNWKKFSFRNFFIGRINNTTIFVRAKENCNTNEIAIELKSLSSNIPDPSLKLEVERLAKGLNEQIRNYNDPSRPFYCRLIISTQLLAILEGWSKTDIKEVHKLCSSSIVLTEKEISDRNNDCKKNFEAELSISSELYTSYMRSMNLYSCNFGTIKVVNGPIKNSNLRVTDHLTGGVITITFDNIILNAHVSNNHILAIELIDEALFYSGTSSGHAFPCHHKLEPNPKNHRIEIYDFFTQKLLNIIQLPLPQEYTHDKKLFCLNSITERGLYITNLKDFKNPIGLEYLCHRSKKFLISEECAQIALTIKSSNEQLPYQFSGSGKDESFQQPPDSGQNFFQKLPRMLKNFVIQNKKVFFCAASGITVVLIFWKFLQAHPLNS